MKLSIVFIVLFLSIFSPVNSRANPFASKLLPQEDPVAEPTKPVTKISYQGYAVIDGKKYAIIRLNGKQFTLCEGERINQIRIDHISEDQLQYSIKGKNLKITQRSLP